MSSRLSLALNGGGLDLPAAGEIVVFHPRADMDLTVLPRARVRIVQPFRPDHDAWRAAGYDCAAEAGPGPFAAALVCMPRAKAQARALVAQAMAATAGPVIVDGARTDGIDSLLREIRARAAVSGPVAKAHGKLFWLTGDAAVFADWLPGEARTPEGFVTAPGVFSADGIDPASAALAAALPGHLGRRVVDLGGGWGYLAARILERAEVEILDLVEADHVALGCARRNLADPRARFHWADAAVWTPDGAVDAVVTNPPFHGGRAADPSLGRAFIAAAARILSPAGSLWLVANRHLPYEASLTEHFSRIEELAGDGRFKLMHAARPVRRRVARSGR